MCPFGMCPWPLVSETGGLHGKAARKMVSEMRDRAASSGLVPEQ